MKSLLAKVKSLAGIEGAALLSRDGLPVIADLPPSFDRETFSAMVAAMVGAAETALIEAGRGVPDRIILENSQTRILATGVSDQFLLVISAKPSTDFKALDGSLSGLLKELKAAST